MLRLMFTTSYCSGGYDERDSSSSLPAWTTRTDSTLRRVTNPHDSGIMIIRAAATLGEDHDVYLRDDVDIYPMGNVREDDMPYQRRRIALDILRSRDRIPSHVYHLGFQARQPASSQL
eukprot:gb/GECG01000042.1/.p1 GENE.gb/GECG01000042.1/~~gb/GECG01000042.1/.p1  ORF type:complete len:118 (+),score=7.67 gb/GECG01000042.1/:1-354(+)